MESSINKFDQLLSTTTFSKLSPDCQTFIMEKAESLGLSFQDTKQLIDIASDIQMWNEESLQKIWPDENTISGKNKPMKTKIMNMVKTSWNELKYKKKDYSNFHRKKANHPKHKIIDRETGVFGLGRCPVASPKTRCCNLLTMDLVRNCGYDCSYCCIQSFFHNNEILFEKNPEMALKKLKLDRNKIYHIGTGQASDSLMWGNRNGMLEGLIKFATENPNVILELKTKSDNVDFLLKNEIPKNIICTWTLNTETIIQNEEHLTAPLANRLRAARQLADKGIIVGFHFHPIIYYANWENEYSEIVKKIMENFKPEEIAMISLGTLTFIKDVVNKIRGRDLKSKILQMPLVSADGKLSYPREIKLELFTQVYQSFKEWHHQIFFYFCMENHDIWMPVLGREYENNNQFEEDMKKNYIKKIKCLPV